MVQSHLGVSWALSGLCRQRAGGIPQQGSGRMCGNDTYLPVEEEPGTRGSARLELGCVRGNGIIVG